MVTARPTTAFSPSEDQFRRMVGDEYGIIKVIDGAVRLITFLPIVEDAANDLFSDYLTNRMRTRGGNYRPYRFGIPPLCAMVRVLLFTDATLLGFGPEKERSR
jgi:hypothetical protein